jgi:hypothetical protein
VAELDPVLVDRAVAEATERAANLDYFFDALTSADWIAPLEERRMFSDPPEQRIEDGYIRAPGWSASRYLARMAAEANSVLTCLPAPPRDVHRTSTRRLRFPWLQASRGGARPACSREIQISP